MKADPSRYLEFRRDIHRHPELSNQEVETTRRTVSYTHLTLPTTERV